MNAIIFLSKGLLPAVEFVFTNWQKQIQQLAIAFLVGTKLTKRDSNGIRKKLVWSH